MKRFLQDLLQESLQSQVCFLIGPRGVGKNTLSSSLNYRNIEHLDFETSEGRLMIIRKRWNRKADLIVFHEIQKMPHWETWLKKVVDSEGLRPRMLILCSSLQENLPRGKVIRLHPLMVSETLGTLSAREAYERMKLFGGFPEPFLRATEPHVRFWREQQLNSVLHRDLIDLCPMRSVRSFQLLLDLLSERVGKPLSCRSLALELDVATFTVQRWIKILESLMIIFSLRPYTPQVPRSLLKEPKIYFYDSSRIKNTPQARMENTIACELHAHLHNLEAVRGEKHGLFYLRDLMKHEADFAIVRHKQPERIVDCCMHEDEIQDGLRYFSQRFPKARAFQMLEQPGHKKSPSRVEAVQASDWLANLGQ